MAESRLYPSHVRLPLPAKLVLSLGSAVGAFMYPQRADLVAAVGELTGSEALRRMYNRMLHDNTGLNILSEKPVITVTCPACWSAVTEADLHGV